MLEGMSRRRSQARQQPIHRTVLGAILTAVLLMCIAVIYVLLIGSHSLPSHR